MLRVQVVGEDTERAEPATPPWGPRRFRSHEEKRGVQLSLAYHHPPSGLWGEKRLSDRPA